MDSRSENKMSSYAATADVLDQNKARWQTVPGIVKVVNKLLARMDTINTLEQQMSAGTKGATAAKQAAREDMMNATLVVAGAVRAYASDIGDNELLANGACTPTDLSKARDSDVANLCQFIHDTAQGVVAHLADNDVTADTLTDLQEKIDAYEGANGKPRSTRSSSKAARGQVKAEMAAINKVLEFELDGLMAKFKTSQPAFYSAYFTSRDVVNNAAGRKPNNGDNNHDAPPAPH